MKNELKISTLAIVCVLCTAFSGAYGASSVRALGGTGTYSSASSATAANSGSSATVRGGSVRVTPSTGNSGGSATSVGSTNSGRVVTTPRLSIGKYLGGSTSISTGSSLRPQLPSSGGSSGGDGSMDPGVAEDLQKAVEGLQDSVVELKDADDEIKGVLEGKQNTLITTDDYITIENDEIFVNLDNLKDALADATGGDGREIELGKVGDYLVWRYVGDSSWNNLIAIADITGPQGPKGEKGEPGDPADLVNYPTKTDMEDAISAAIDSLAATYATKEELADYVKTETATATYATKEELTSGLSGKLDNGALTGYATTVGVQAAISEATSGLATSEDLTSGLAGKANAADVYTKSEVYNKTEVNDLVADVAAGDMEEALKEYAKTADVEAGLAEKADKTALEAKADTTVVEALSSKVDTVGTAADNASLAAATAVETAGEAKTAADAAKTAADEAKNLATGANDVAQEAKTAATTAQEKADAAALEVVAKADKATTLAGYGITDAYTKAEVDSVVDGFVTDADLTELEGQVQTNTSNIGTLKTTVGEGALTTTAQNLVGAVNELKTKTDGMATDGNFEEMNNKITQMEQTVNTAVESIEGKADTTYVDEELAKKANASDLGSLAAKSSITNADVADDAAIARTKLAADVQASLDKADSAVSMEGAGKDAVLGVDSNGDKVWYEIAF